jgi:transcriptional regulator with GAF, ATPase, and Fis domain
MSAAIRIAVDSLNTTPELESREAIAPKRPGVLFVHPRELFVGFSSDVMSFGRGEDCSAVLPSEHVSRVHARVRRVGPVFVLSDAGSRNGTFKNGQRIEESALDPGDLIRIGDFIGVMMDLEPAIAASGAFFEETEAGVIVGPRSAPEWRRLRQVAASGTPILLEGPTGAGKEVLARALHRHSGRSGPFVGVNCAALPETLAEAQLFGHARGAYTGAVQSSEGLIAAADRGTLLLDEVADLPLSQQAKLLRVLEEGEVVRIGETAPRAIDVRFVAACQEPLWKLVQRGEFRADLLGRLSGCTLRLPALNQRREEIPRLFAAAFAKAGGAPSRLKSSAIELLCLSPWPLNVRQLVLFAVTVASSFPGEGEIGRHALTELLAKAGEEFGEPVLPDEVGDDQSLGRRRARWLARHETKLGELRAALDATRGNVSEAARKVGLSRSAATRLIEADASRKQLDKRRG